MSGTPKTGRKTATPLTRRVVNVPVDRIRPEDGLGRQRDREGHLELQRSIEQFGVLTPVTVRLAPDGSGDFLLIKGQGRTLACQLLGIKTIPALVVDADEAENQKVQQFLVENVARLRMAAVDRALLIGRARRKGEETIDVARRFGVTPATVRRLEAQIENASSSEVAALRAGDVNLALHAVIAKHVPAEERAEAIARVTKHGIRAKEMDALFVSLGWRKLVELGPAHRDQRLALLEWSVNTLAGLPHRQPRDRIRQMASQMPLTLPPSEAIKEAAG